MRKRARSCSSTLLSQSKARKQLVHPGETFSLLTDPLSPHIPNPIAAVCRCRGRARNRRQAEGQSQSAGQQREASITAVGRVVVAHSMAGSLNS